MFETVVPETVAPRSRKLFFEVLPLSLGVHALAGAAMVASSIWTVAFPTQSPRMYQAYHVIAAPPPPPPPPPPPAARRAAVVPQTKTVPVKMPLVAPTVIPDVIPQVTNEPYVESPQAPVDGVGGDPNGVEGGVEGGEVGGAVGGVEGGLPQAPPPDVIEVKRDAPLPVGAISQEHPGYPWFAWQRRWEDTLVVRYIIGKNGKVKDVIVLSPPEHEVFTRETVSKIRHWRFHPYRDEKGEPKEVSHELTVRFRIIRR